MRLFDRRAARDESLTMSLTASLSPRLIIACTAGRSMMRALNETICTDMAALRCCSGCALGNA